MHSLGGEHMSTAEAYSQNEKKKSSHLFLFVFLFWNAKNNSIHFKGLNGWF